MHLQTCRQSAGSSCMQAAKIYSHIFRICSRLYSMTMGLILYVNFRLQLFIVSFYKYPMYIQLHESRCSCKILIFIHIQPYYTFKNLWLIFINWTIVQWWFDYCRRVLNCIFVPSFVPTPIRIDWNDIQQSWLAFKKVMQMESNFHIYQGRNLRGGVWVCVAASY